MIEEDLISIKEGIIQMRKKIGQNMNVFYVMIIAKQQSH